MSIFFPDPVLQWLEPEDLMRLKCLNKDHSSVIETYMKTKSWVHVHQRTFMPWHTRLLLYNQYPNIQTLIIDVSDIRNLKDFLRPTLRALCLRVRFDFEEDLETNEITLFYSNAIITAFQDVQDYLEATPESLLEELRIEFAPRHTFRFIYKDGIVVDYDRGGPIYEDTEQKVEIPEIPPSYLLEMLDAVSWNAIQEKVTRVCSMTRWKRIVLPYYFPGAESLSSARFTDRYEITTDDLWNVDQYLQELKWRVKN
jgi:hypothetical protein